MSYGKQNVDWMQRIDWPTIRQYRIDRADKIMHKNGIGTLVIFGWDYRRYLSSMFSHPYEKHLPHRRVVVKLRDAGYPYCSANDMLKEWMPWMKGRLVGRDVVSNPIVYHMYTDEQATTGWDKMANQIKALMKKHSVADLPVGVDWAGPNCVHALERAGLEVVDANNTMQEAMMIKHDEECEVIRQACTCNEAGFGNVFANFKIGMREIDIAALYIKAAIEAGAEYAEGWCVGSGPRPHARSMNWSDRIIRPGEFLGIECCHLRYCGYSSCYDRTFVVGQPGSEAQKALYHAVVQNHYAFQKNLKPGVTTQWLEENRPIAANFLPNKYKKQARGGIARGQSTQHSMGMMWGSAPQGDGAPVTLEKNMVFAAHTQGWLEGIPDTGISVENTYRITDTGWENFNKWPYEELMQLGP